MSYSAQAHVTTGDVATAALQNILLDNIGFIVGGLVGTGFTLIDLLGAVAPAVSAAGHSKIIHNTTNARIEASINGGAFNAIGLPAHSATANIAREVFG